MQNNSQYSKTNKRYYIYDYYLKTLFHEKVFKVSLDAGFSFPNRDGKISTGGCIFWNGAGVGEFSGDIQASIEEYSTFVYEKIFYCKKSKV